MRYLILSLACVALLAQGQPGMPDAPRWRLEDIYRSVEAWRQDLAQARIDLAAIDGAPPDWTASAQTMVETLKRFEVVSLRLGRLDAFATLQAQMDLTSPMHKGLAGEVTPLSIELAQQVARRDAKLRVLGRDGLELRLRERPELRAFRAWFDRALRDTTHALSEEGERVMAEAAWFSGGARDAALTLQTRELPPRRWTRPDGQQAPMDGPTYRKLVASKDPKERQAAAEAMVSDLVPLEHTCAALLDTCVKRNVFEARTRKHADAFAAECFPHDFDPKVARSLLAALRANLGPYHRYLQLKKRILGLSEAFSHDLEQPLFPDARLSFPFPFAKDLFLASSTRLGPDYAREAEEAFTGGWVDALPRPGKAPGGSVTSVSGVHPFALLNHRGSFFDTITLAHELGHALHFHLSARAQPFAQAEPAYLLTEVPSTLSEVLVVRQLLATTPDRTQRRAVLAAFLDRLCVLLVFDGRVAELEEAMHAHVEQGGTLSAEWLNAKQLSIARTYAGHNQGVVKVADHEGSTWNYPATFFDTWRGYKLVVATVAALVLAEHLEQGGTSAQTQVLTFLKAGCSKPPLLLLRDAGVDLADPACLAKAMLTFDRLVDELEALVPGTRPTQKARLLPDRG